MAISQVISGLGTSRPLRHLALLLMLPVALLAVLSVVPPAGAGPVEGTAGQTPPPPAGGALPPVPGPVLRAFEAPVGPYGPGHRGVDLAAHPGETIVAALAGTVAFSGTVAGTGWLTLDHGGGLVTTYGPLDDRVAEGGVVDRGARIGRLAGQDTSPPPDVAAAAHLDWGARLEGDYIDPLLLLQRWSLRLTAAVRDVPGPGS